MSNDSKDEIGEYRIDELGNALNKYVPGFWSSLCEGRP